MKRYMMFLGSMFLLATMSGCVVAPWGWDDEGYGHHDGYYEHHGGHHHDGYDRGYGGYRRY